MSNPTTPQPPKPAPGVQAAPAPQPTPTMVDPSVTLAELMKQVAELKQKEEVRQKQEVAKLESTFEPKPKAAQPAKKEIDWSKVREEDVFSMDIPVPTLEHSLATYLDVKLLDQNYVARWVQVKAHNLGPRLRLGWRFVTKADLDPNFPHALDFDTNGRYSFDDVVCLMIPKSIYYAKLKQNYNRATMIQRKKEVKARTDIPGLTDELPIQQAFDRGAMEFYEPNAPKTNMEQL